MEQTLLRVNMLHFGIFLNFQLLDFSGALQFAVCEFEHLAYLRNNRFSPTAGTRRCHCATQEASNSDISLLVVRGLASLRTLRTALQPYCDNRLPGGLTTSLIRKL